MWSLELIVVDEGCEPALCTGAATHPRLMEAVDPHGEHLGSLFDQIPLDVVKTTAQIAPREGGQIAHPVDEKRRLEDVVSPSQLTEKLGSRIGSTPFGTDRTEQQLRLDIDRGVQPVLLGSDLYCCCVDRDPRRRHRLESGAFSAVR